jgi:hypothetical protein
MSAEEFGERPDIHLRHHKEIAALQKETVGHQGMEVGMPPGVITESPESRYSLT